MKTRSYYEKRYKGYPDLVTLKEFCAMMGGMGQVQAYNLLRQDLVTHFLVRHTYLIPKSCVIDYILSDHYEQYRHHLKSHI